MEKKLGGLPMIVFTAACALAGFLLRTAQRGGGSPAALIAVSAAAALALAECRRPAPPAGKAAATFDRVRTFLDYNYTRPIGRGELAERFGLNANYLSELFRRMGGCGVQEYIEARRFDMARRLLRTTELPVKTVAEHCGFSGEVYFIRRFRELHGRPPGRYRIEQNS